MANPNAANTSQASNANMQGAKVLDVSKITQDTSNPCVLETGDIASTLGAPIGIDRPAAGSVQELALEPGSNYLFGFGEGEVSSIVESCGDLVMTFSDGGQLTLTNFTLATDADNPSVLAFAGDVVPAEGEIEEAGDGEIVDITEIIETVPADEALEEPQVEVRESVAAVASEPEQPAEQVANIEPAAGEETAQQLAQIEPAAGGDDAGATGNSGFGFNSDFSPTGVIPLTDVGPIDPTLLNYGITLPNTDLLFQEDDEPVNGNPILLSPGVFSLDESNLDGGPNTISDTLDIDFGSDGRGEICANSDFDFSGSALNNALSSEGNAITVTPSATGYVGTINGGADTVFEFILDVETGEYTFNQLLPLDHADGTDPNDVIQLSFGVKATDSDGDVAESVVLINIADDAPLAQDDVNAVQESGTVTGNILANDDGGEDGSPVITEFNGQPIPAGGLEVVGTYGTLTIQQDGSYSYVANANNPEGVDSWPYTIRDADGDTSSATLSITVTPIDDKPKIDVASDIVDETDLSGGDIVRTGQLNIDYGTDGPGAVTPNDFSFSGSALNGGLTSNGNPVTVTIEGTTYVGKDSLGNTIFTMDVQPDGSYEFTLIGTLDHADPNDPNDIINLEFQVNAQDSDDDVTPTTITIGVKDDVPTIGDSRGDVDETNFDVGGTLTYADTIDTNFGVEIGSVTPNGGAVTLVGGNPVAITSNGDAVTFTQTDNGYIGTTNNGTVTVFELVMNPETGKYDYTQFETLDHPDGTDANDVIELSFDFAVTSTDGDGDTGTVVIAVADDGVVANDDVNGAEEGQNITGSVTANDDFSQDEPNEVTQVQHLDAIYLVSEGNPAIIPTSLGTLTLNFDGSYSFQATDLGDPDGVAEFIYTLVDGDGDSDTAKLSIRVTPDGEPVAVTEEMTVDETNLTPGPLVINETLDVDFGLDGEGTITPNGNVTVSESSAAGSSLTSGGQPVEIIPTDDGYVGVIEGTTTKVFELIVQNNGDYSFELFQTLDHADATDPNDLIKLEFGITIADADQDTVDGTITINVLDDAPVAYDDTDTVAENTLSTDGNVTDNDIFGEDTPSVVTSISFNGIEVPVVAGQETVINGDYGVLRINADGSYIYTSNGTNTTAVTDTFTYALTDFDGDTDTAELVINIADVNVKPEIEVKPLVVDETDLDPTDSDSDTAIGTFGVDGPGTYKVTGAASFDFDATQATDGTLTSNGVPVVVGVEDGAYVGRADGEVIFTFGINAETGEYTFTLVGTLDHADSTDPNDALNLTFGVDAVDSDGDATTGLVKVTVLDDGPVANDDSVTFDQDDKSVNGNVIPNDDLSEDVQNTVTKVSFGANSIDVPETGTNSIDGDFGTLEIAADGSYTYTLFDDLGGAPVTSTFKVTPTDLDGFQSSVTVNGITITSVNGGDLVFQDAGVVGSGAGIQDGSGSDNVFGNDEILNVSFAPVSEVKFTIAEIGDNNVDGVLDYIVRLSDGSEVTGDFDISSVNVVGGKFSFTLDASDYGEGLSIVDVDLFSIGNDRVSFLLNEVEVSRPGDNPECTEDEFIYTLTDADGDNDTAILEIKAKDNDEPIVATVKPLIVDETDLVDKDSDTVTANFGDDAPGTFEVTGVETFDFVAAQATDGTLTSDGVPVVVSTEGNAYVGKANGEDVFRFELNNTTGQYTFTLLGTLDHANTNDPNDALELTFGVTARDSDNDTGTALVKVTVLDDGPSIDSKARPIDESDFDNGSVSYTHKLNFDYGEDGAGAINPNDKFTAKFQVNGPDVTLSSGGVDIDVSETANGYVGVAGGKTIFTLDIKDDGEYTYTQFAGIDHPDATNPDDVIWLKFGVEIVDADGDSKNATIIVDVHDDAPKAVDDVAAAEEGQTIDGNVITNDVVGLDTPGSVTMVNGQNVGENGLTVVGNYGSLTIQQDGSYSYTANSNNPDGVDSFEYKLSDFDGDVDKAVLEITVTSENDVPTISNKTRGVDETDLENGPIGFTQNYAFDYGNDGAGSIMANGTFFAKAVMGGKHETLYSHGEEIIVSVNADGEGYTGIAGGRTIFTVDLSVDGKYTYEQIDTIDHFDPTNPDDVIWMKFGVKITDADGDTAEALLSVDVHDDGPEISNKTRGVQEADLENGPIGFTQRYPFDYGEDGAGSIVANGEYFGKAVMGGKDTVFYSNGAEIVVSHDADGYVGIADGKTIFTVDVGTDGFYTYTQYAAIDHPDPNDSNEAIWLKFGVTITDADGDTQSALLTVDVYDSAPTAHDDCVEFYAQQEIIDGNVIDNDNVRADQPGSITKVSFGDHTIDVPATGTNSIDGDHGTLEIAADGSYTYTLFDASLGSKTGAMKRFNPQESDVQGIQESITKKGITIYVANDGEFDLTWLNTDVGNGIGISNFNGSDNPKVWPRGEALNVSFTNDMASVELTIAEIGDNNDDGEHGLDYIITFADGSTQSGEQQFVPDEINGGLFSFELSADNFDGKLISSVEISSQNTGEYIGASFLLNNVKVTEPDEIVESVEDQFEYVLSDFDGDTSEATLKIKANGDDGSVQIANDNDVLYGTDEADIFVFAEIDDSANVIKDFDITDGDVIDLTQTIGEANATQDAIDNFVFKATVNGDTQISVDVNGSGNAANATAIAILEGVNDVNLDLAIKTSDSLV